MCQVVVITVNFIVAKGDQNILFAKYLLISQRFHIFLQWIIHHSYFYTMAGYPQSLLELGLSTPYPDPCTYLLKFEILVGALVFLDIDTDTKGDNTDAATDILNLSWNKIDLFYVFALI